MITQKKETITIATSKEYENLCRQCEKIAMCNNFDCYKKKQGNMNCTACEERLCQHHWRIYFRRKIKR